MSYFKRNRITNVMGLAKYSPVAFKQVLSKVAFTEKHFL